MATSRLCTGDEKKGGDVSCTKPKSGNQKTKTEKLGNKKSRYRKEIIYSEKSNEPVQNKVVEKTNLVVSDAIKEQEKPETQGITFKGQTSQKTTDSGNKTAGKDDMSRVKETRYFKKRSRIGQILTGEAEKQKGGKLESQTKSGEKEVITFKGKGRGAKKFTEKGDIEENEKKKYEEAKKVEDSKLVKDFGSDARLASMPYISKQISGGKPTDYRLGDATKDKEWRTDKKQYEYDVKNVRTKNKKIDTKVKRNALSKIRLNG